MTRADVVSRYSRTLLTDLPNAVVAPLLPGRPRLDSRTRSLTRQDTGVVTTIIGECQLTSITHDRAVRAHWFINYTEPHRRSRPGSDIEPSLPLPSRVFPPQPQKTAVRPMAPSFVDPHLEEAVVLYGGVPFITHSLSHVSALLMYRAMQCTYVLPRHLTPLNGKKKCGAYRGTFLVRVFPLFPLQFAYLLRSGAHAAEQKLARHLSSVENIVENVNPVPLYPCGCVQILEGCI
jgi:hypothetical protein